MKIPIYITSSNTVIYKSGDSLVVDRKGKKIPLPIESVSYIVKFGNSRISDQTLNFCADKGIIINRFSYGGKPCGTFLPPEHNIAKTRLQQYEAYFSNEKRMKVARELVFSSALNKIQVLKKHKDKNTEIKNSVEQIKELIKKINSTDAIDSLRGVEGAIGASYFSGLKHCFKYLNFNGRTYNPPKDEINALLSFGYAVLYCEIYSKVFEHSLCPFLGYLHEQNNGQQSLVYDISEVFKQSVDLLILSMINNNQFKDFHFNKKEDGSCLLSTQGKAFFLKQWIPFLRKVKKLKCNSELIREEVIKLKHFLEGIVDYTGHKI